MEANPPSFELLEEEEETRAFRSSLRAVTRVVRVMI